MDVYIQMQKILRENSANAGCSEGRCCCGIAWFVSLESLCPFHCASRFLLIIINIGVVGGAIE